MPKFIMTYRGGSKPKTPEEGQAHMARWQAWLADLGEAAIEPGTRMGQSQIVTSDGVSENVPNPMSGYSIIEATDMEAALKIAKACPFVEMDTAAMEVGEIMEMNN